MELSLIVAAARNNAIGRNNELLWHLPDDFKFFKETTKGHVIIMGRKTYQSIGRPLPNRTNLVITRHLDFQAPGCEVYKDLEDALHRAYTLDKNPFVIGGAEIYRQTLSRATQVYLTSVDYTPVDADAFFPELPESDWEKTWEEFHPADERHTYAFSFCLYKRRKLK